jgi:hypothetical protein
MSASIALPVLNMSFSFVEVGMTYAQETERCGI